jgi:hypothetical protein
MKTKTKTKTTDYTSPEERLSELPGNWRYAVAPPEETKIFHQTLCELLAEEADGGAMETLKISNLITAFAANPCLVWLDDVRKVLQRVPAAEAIVGKTTEAKLESAKAKSETDHAKAVEELERAKRGIIVAETKVKTAANDLDRFREASNLLADPPGHAKAAVDHLKRLQGAG